MPPTPAAANVDRRLLNRVRRLRVRSRRRAGGDLLGNYRSRVKGRGLEYLESREYEPGDDIRHMDWKVMARTGVPHTKVFHEERQLHVLIYVDVSASMRFGGPVRTKLHTALQAAAVLAYAAVRERDRAEVVLFSDRVVDHVGPVQTERQFWRLLRHLDAVDPVPRLGGSRDGQATDLGLVGEEYAHRRRHPQVVFLFSDFQATAGGTVRHHLPARHSDVFPVQVLSRLELDAPGGIRPLLADAERGGGDVGLARVRPVERFWGAPVGLLDDREDVIAGLGRVLARRGR